VAVGATQVTVSAPTPVGVAVKTVGGDGTVGTCRLAAMSDHALLPTALKALTLISYVAPTVGVGMTYVRTPGAVVFVVQDVVSVTRYATV